MYRYIRFLHHVQRRPFEGVPRRAGVGQGGPAPTCRERRAPRRTFLKAAETVEALVVADVPTRARPGTAKLIEPDGGCFMGPRVRKDFLAELPALAERWE